jgi:hypothetical protein
LLQWEERKQFEKLLKAALYTSGLLQFGSLLG